MNEILKLEEEFIETLYDENDILSTIDNPYSPREEFEKWLNWDRENGHNTLELIARFVILNVNDDDTQMLRKRSKAIAFILENDDEDKYILL